MSHPPQVDIGMNISPEIDIASNISKTLSMPDKSKTYQNKSTSDLTSHGQDLRISRPSKDEQKSHDSNKVALMDEFTNTVFMVC